MPDIAVMLADARAKLKHAMVREAEEMAIEKFGAYTRCKAEADAAEAAISALVAALPLHRWSTGAIRPQGRNLTGNPRYIRVGSIGNSNSASFWWLPVGALGDRGLEKLWAKMDGGYGGRPEVGCNQCFNARMPNLPAQRAAVLRGESLHQIVHDRIKRNHLARLVTRAGPGRAGCGGHTVTAFAAGCGFLACHTWILACGPAARKPSMNYFRWFAHAIVGG